MFEMGLDPLCASVPILIIQNTNQIVYRNSKNKSKFVNLTKSDVLCFDWVKQIAITRSLLENLLSKEFANVVRVEE